MELTSFRGVRKLRPRKLRPRKLRPRKLRPRKLRPRKLRPSRNYAKEEITPKGVIKIIYQLKAFHFDKELGLIL